MRTASLASATLGIACTTRLTAGGLPGDTWLRRALTCKERAPPPINAAPEHGSKGRGSSLKLVAVNRELGQNFEWSPALRVHPGFGCTPVTR